VRLNFNPLIHTFLISEQPTIIGGAPLFFGRKNRRRKELQVDLGDLQNEKEHLSSFLQLNLKASVVPFGNKLTVNSEKLSAQELQRVVTKFVYHRNFNTTHWVSIEGTTVRINRFKGNAKKKEKHKKNTLHQTPAQSWGL
jgi:hypothetical protein